MTFRKLMTEAWQENILYSALLELTYKCNLDCYFCYNDLGMRGTPLRLDDYIRLLDDLASMQVMVVTLSGGEPLAHPDFFAIGRAARERGFVVRVKSNGHGLRDELAKRLREEVDPYIIELSLHGASAETHDRQTRIAGSFDRLLENLLGLRSLGMRFKLNSTLTLWNQFELERMYAIADSLGVELQIDPTVTPRDDGDTAPLGVSATPEGLKEFARVQAARAAGLDSLERPAEDGGLPSQGVDKHCGAGALTMAVDPYGGVYPCVAWRTAVGNVHEESIRTIWERSNQLQQIREGTVSAKKTVAAEGELGRYLSFCPGLAVNLTGKPDVVPEQQRRQGLLLKEAFAAQALTEPDDGGTA